MSKKKTPDQNKPDVSEDVDPSAKTPSTEIEHTPDEAEDDLTIIAPLPKGEDDDDDYTIFAASPDTPSAEDAEDDDDLTIIAPEMGAVASPDEEEDDLTIIAPVVPAGAGNSESETTDSPLFEDNDMEPTQISMPSGLSGGARGEPLTTLEPGTVINNMYRVEERLDQGGMGRVFRGVEIGTGESVAIKVILPEMAEDVRVGQMFRREARTLRQLHHDAIVRYFAYVPPDAQLNLHALVMGFIEGNKLSDKLRDDGPMSEADVCRLFERLADGLERAHKIGVVHRDLAPDNVMLPDDDIDKAVLIDFGISRSSKVKDVTIGNEFAGKLKYVSPEQLGAYTGEAEAPSDVYSLGLLMIAALTGKAVKMGDSIVEAVQMRQTVPDLSELPFAFQGLLYQMLQPDPAQRLPSMAHVIEGLKAIRGGDTTTGADSLYATTFGTKTRAVPGLQAAPVAGTDVGTFTTTTAAPRSETTPPRPTPEPEGRHGGGLIASLIVLLGLVGGGGWYYMTQMPAAEATATTDGPDGQTRVPDTEATFLAEALPEGCTFATLRGQGPNAGLIEGFAATPGILDGLADKWTKRFGSTPGIVDRPISEPQCAALEFARSFQGARGGMIEISVEQDTVTRAEGVVGTIQGSAGRNNWLALVDPKGRVFSLMAQLDDPIGDQRSFSFRLPSAQPGTYVLIATASEDALVRAGAMNDGTAAAKVLPLMTGELSKDDQGAVDIGVVNITR